MPTSLLQLLSIISFISILGHAYSQCQDDQKALLLELKNELIFNSSISTKLVDWNQTDDCCKWKGVGCSSGGHVTSLQLDHEGISGGVENSSSLVSLEYLKKLNLAHNSLNGTIPYLNLSNLVELDLSSNQLKGPISDSFFIDLDSLEVLSLSHNFHNLTTLDLSQNLSLAASSINSNWSRFSQLKEFSLASCNLQYFPEFIKQSNLNLVGDFPKSLQHCTSLWFVNVEGNMIGGSFPCMLPSRLKVLVLRSNKFDGEVKCGESWLNLQIMDIAYNNFSGDLRHIGFSSLRTMMRDGYAHMSEHTIIGVNVVRPGFHYLTRFNLTFKGFRVELHMILSEFSALDFSCNGFQGEIPEAIGDLSSLRFLNLSHNALTGRIPRSFGNMAVLEALDLSANQLAETIPVELADLTFLTVLNLSYNKLVGEIPNSRQLQTFSADSFTGNRGLCGFNLNISCTTWKLSNDAAPWKVEDGVIIYLFLTFLAFL